MWFSSVVPLNLFTLMFGFSWLLCGQRRGHGGGGGGGGGGVSPSLDGQQAGRSREEEGEEGEEKGRREAVCNCLLLRLSQIIGFIDLGLGEAKVVYG